MELVISRYEVMKQIDTGEPFNLVFITADRRRGTGGKIKHVREYVKIQARQLDQLPVHTWEQLSKPRNPNHLEHRTINIYNPSKPGEHAYKVHWRLMIFFNGKRIVQ